MKSCRFEIEDPISPKGEEALCRTFTDRTRSARRSEPRINIVAAPGIRSAPDRNREKHPCVFGNFVKLLKTSAPRSAAPPVTVFLGIRTVSSFLLAPRAPRFCLPVVSQRDDKLFFQLERTQYSTFVSFTRARVILFL